MGEFTAQEYLQLQGYWLLRRNWRCRAGEIDLVMRTVDTVVLVEVKTRLSGRGALEHVFASVDRKKRRRLKLLARLYALEAGLSVEPRVDAIGVILDPKNLLPLEVIHHSGLDLTYDPYA